MTAMRRVSLRAALLVALVLAGAAVATLPARASAGERARITDYFTPADLERSRRYRGPAYALGFGSLAAGLAVAAALGLGPGARRLGALSASVTGGRWALQALLLAAVLALAAAVVELPFAAARLLHDRRFGLATQSLPGHLADAGKAAAVGVAMAGAAAVAFVGLARALPRAWPAVAAAAAAAVAVLVVFVFPVVWEPLFNRFVPVDGATRARVLALAWRAGVHVDDVLVADASRRTTRLGAYVSGLGATRRVVLYDTLLERASPREVDLVVAHELAHVAHRDVLKGTALAAAGAAGFVLLARALLGRPRILALAGAAGPGDPRILPFLAFALAVAQLLAMPAFNWASRRMEAAADRAAVALTGDARTAIEVEVALARANVADLEPNALVRWAFFTHPTVLERIQIALDAGGGNPSG
jgi:STE24 endopeptidase